MLRQSVARALLAFLIAMTALVGGAGVARADPDDVAPPIIDDLLVLLPSLALDPRDRDAPQYGAGPHDWGASGMFCQNQHVKCQKMGF